MAKALRSEPAYRYATVDSLKLDVERVLAGEPVATREGARLYVLAHLLRRYRRGAAAVAAIMLSLASHAVRRRVRGRCATAQAGRSGPRIPLGANHPQTLRARAALAHLRA